MLVYKDQSKGNTYLIGELHDYMVEDEYAISNGWHRMCGNQDADALLRYGVIDIHNKKVVATKTQDIVLSGIDIERKLEEIIKTDPTSNIIYRCGVIARNLDWARKIMEMNLEKNKSHL